MACNVCLHFTQHGCGLSALDMLTSGKCEAGIRYEDDEQERRRAEAKRLEDDLARNGS